MPLKEPSLHVAGLSMRLSQSLICQLRLGFFARTALDGRTIEVSSIAQNICLMPDYEEVSTMVLSMTIVLMLQERVYACCAHNGADEYHLKWWRECPG